MHSFVFGGIYILIHTLVSGKGCGRFVFVQGGLHIPFQIKIHDLHYCKVRIFKREVMTLNQCNR